MEMFRSRSVRCVGFEKMKLVSHPIPLLLSLMVCVFTGPTIVAQQLGLHLPSRARHSTSRTESIQMSDRAS